MNNSHFTLAKEIIESKKDSIVSASLGIQEDFFWTGETVFEDGKFTTDLDTATIIAGIGGSSWGTPCVVIDFPDGRTETYSCYTGESESERPAWLGLGVLSGPVQERIPTAKNFEA